MMTCSIDKNKIHQKMKENNIKTQSELAQKMGITKNQLSVILSEKTNPIKSNVQILCDVLGVSASEIIFEKKEQQISFLKENKIEEEIWVETETIKPKKNFRVLELFAGAGGLALGLHLAGFSPVALVECDKSAAQTLRENQPKWNVIEKDIIEVAKEGIQSYIPKNLEIDLISGGYPCQAFSYAGNKKGLEDVRGTMFYYYASILEEIKPKMFLAENVKGLLTHDDGKTLKKMIQIFKDIGYQVSYHILKAVDYGVAQKRERLTIIGIRNDIKIRYRLPKPQLEKKVLRDVLKNVPSSIGEKYPEKKRKILELVPPGGYWRDLPKDIAKDYMGKSYYSGGGRTGMARRISWDEPCLTLTCSPAQKQTERCHPDEVRPFTVREYARIQSFPDEWKFFGSQSQQYKQIGNAVPVALAKAIGLSIIDVLNKIS